MIVEIRGGESRQYSGAQDEARGGPYRETIVNDVGLGRFFEACRNGRIYHTYTQNLTIAGTHNTPLAAATGTAICGLINTSSNKAAAILSGFISSVTGTPATNAQAVWNAAITATSVTAAATGTIIPGLIGGSASSMKVMNNIALTGLNIAASNLLAIRPFGGAPANLGIAANHDAGVTDPVDGAIIVPPSAFIGIFAGTSAGTTWIVNAGITWAETDWPL